MNSCNIIHISTSHLSQVLPDCRRSKGILLGTTLPPSPFNLTSFFWTFSKELNLYFGLILFSYAGLRPKWLLIHSDQPCSTKDKSYLLTRLSQHSHPLAKPVTELVAAYKQGQNPIQVTHDFPDSTKREGVFLFFLFSKTLTIFEGVLNRMKYIYFQKLLNSNKILTLTCSLNWTHMFIYY